MSATAAVSKGKAAEQRKQPAVRQQAVQACLEIEGFEGIIFFSFVMPGPGGGGGG